MSRRDYHEWNLSALAKGLRKGEMTCVELTEHFLSRIRRLDGKLNAFIRVDDDRAMAQARAADLALRAGRDLGPLHGIPFAVKDLFDVRGLPTTAGCRLLEGNVPSRDAAVVRRLIQAGMILVGKTHTVQFAYSGVGINLHYGTPRNPWKPEPHVPGGSSSGSAVAVAAGLVPLALGTDTGGSVRIPAALCGVTGLKTTVGRISREGVYPLSWSLDSVGPLCRAVEDAALAYQFLQGWDPMDEDPPQDLLTRVKRGVQGLRLAFAETVFWEGIHPEVERAVRACGPVLEELGARVESIPFPEAEEARRLNPRGLIIAAEAYTINRKWLEEHFHELDPLVAHRMIKGRDVPAFEYLENARAWERLRRSAVESLRDVDALLVPTTPIPATATGPLEEDRELYAERNITYLRNTSIGNILNLCGLSVPCGFTSEGLPVGLMIYGKPFDEETVLRVGWAFQQATSWHQHRPDLAWAAESP